MTKSHYIDNYLYFQELVNTRWPKDKPDYWQSFYTADHPLHPVSEPSGVLQNVHAQDITKLGKGSKGYKLFRE